MNRNHIVLAGGAIALLIGATSALSHSNQNSDSSSALSVQSSSMLPVPSVAAPPPVQPSSFSAAPPPAAPTLPSPIYYSQQIRACGGREGSANFRAYPSLDPRSIVGVVAYGERVSLTGQTIEGDGVLWYEAIAPDGRMGWIAGCFVDGH